MGEFERENRYLVIKRTDLKLAMRALLKPEDSYCLNSICEAVDLARESRGRQPLCCAVIESDWPEYDPTQNLYRDRCGSWFKNVKPIVMDDIWNGDPQC